MNYRLTKEDYLKMREHQAQLFNRKQTPMDYMVSEAMYTAIGAAREAVRTGNLNVCMQAVALGTGTGKSTSTYAYLAQAYLKEPDFTGAFVVPTIEMAIEAQNSIESLSGEGTTTLYSSLHKDKGVDRARAYDKLGYIPERLVNKSELRRSRIVIVTHAQLVRELKYGVDEGTLFYLGKPRDVVFIDEHPDLVDVVACTPKNIQVLYDALVRENHAHPWLPILSNLSYRMNKLQQGDGPQYQPAHLMSLEEAEVFVPESTALLWELTDLELSDRLRHIEMERYSNVVEFCRAAGKGCAFYSRGEATFFSYRLHFPSTYPGFVLLDATSDLIGLALLHPKVQAVEVPQVRYDNLDTYTMSLPARLRKKRDVIAKKTLGQEYAKYIRDYVITNTSLGAEVLVVVWKDILTQELIDTSDDPTRPLDWEGRRVNTQNWGAGIGLKKYKHKTHVFLFGEYFPLTSANIGVTQAWLQQPLSDRVLQLAVSRRANGDTYLPRGVYGETCIGHVLRWVKQLAMRGTAREIDEYGVCKPMKLFTTMDLTLLMANMGRLFPGAPMPKPADKTNFAQAERRNKRDAFAQLLHNTKDRWCFGADEIEVATGIQQKRLSTEFQEISGTMAPMGWGIKTANELGQPGRMRYVVNEAKRGRIGINNLRDS